MTTRLTAFGRSILLLTFLSSVILAGSSPDNSYARLPFRFERNLGQTDARVEFLARGRGLTLFITPKEAVLKLQSSARDSSRVVRLRWVGSSSPSPAEGLDESAAKSHYFRGSDSTNWHSNIPNYERVRYRQVYRGIDLVYHGARGELEYDFEIAPGGDPSLIQIGLEGVDRAFIDASGDLLLTVGQSTLRQQKPQVFEDANGVRRHLQGRYVLLGKRLIGFEVTGRDPNRAMTIDPVLVYSTFLGGSGSDAASGIAVDASSRVYVVGQTASADFPVTPGAPGTRNSGNWDVYVARLNSGGTRLEYATYLGGRNEDLPSRIALDKQGNAYFIGTTASPDFPTTENAYRRNYSGGAHDVFVTKLNSTGSALLYSSYFGGGTDECASGIALDESGRVYVTGCTSSPNFPVTAGAYSTALSGGYDAFVTKWDLSVPSLVYSTFLGGNNYDFANAVKVDSKGSAYVAGLTYSPNFPTTAGVVQPKLAGHDDSFLAKLNPAGSALVFSTYLGGNCEEETNALALDSEGNAYLTGYVETKNFPATPGAFQTAHHGGILDAFVAKVDGTGTKLHYATYLGGADEDSGLDIVVDSFGNAYVLGYTKSYDFPVTPVAFQAGRSGTMDAFLTKLNPRGSHLAYSTYLGGGRRDDGRALAIDASGDLYAAGSTESQDFPTTPGALRPNLGGDWDAFVTKLRLPTITTVSAASFAASAPVTPESIASGFGTQMVPTTGTADSVPLPSTLADTTVTVRDSAGVSRLSPLFFVSPNQINYLVPEGTSTGVASVIVSNASQRVAFGLLDVERVAPAVFTANYDGRGAAAAFAIRASPDGSQTSQPVFQCGAAAGSCQTLPIDLGAAEDRVFLVLYGTGIRGAASSPPLTARIGGVDAQVLFAGPQGSFVGLDQVNLEVPRSLRGRGEVDVVLTAGQRTSNPVRVSFQ